MASRLGKIEIYLSSTATGLPLPSVTIDIRRQGAQIVSGGPTTFTINNPGAIRHSSETGAPSSDSCICYKADGTVRDANIRGVTALSATSITVATGFSGTADDDRISPVTNLPVIYEDSEGTTSIASSRLTTDANGYAAAWTIGGAYDAVVNPDNAGGQPTQYIIPDVEARAADTYRSNVFPTGTQTAVMWDFLRTLGVNDTLFSILNGSDRFKIMGDGEIVAGVSGATHNLTGSLTVSGTILGNVLQATTDAVVGGVIDMTAATSRITPGATSFAVRNTGDTLDNLLVVEAGDVTVRRDHDCRRVLAKKGTALVAGDFTLSAGWGVGATVAIVGGTAYDTRGSINITAAGTPSANPNVNFSFKDGVYAVAPFSICCRGDSVAPAGAYWQTGNGAAGSAGFVFIGTPVAANTYNLTYFNIG